jgi:XTP/dITP diphosphohydrolase
MICVMATQNRGKLSELHAAGLPFACKALSDWTLQQADETGSTFIENAIIKARHASAITGMPALADDSGLMLPSLGGEPGVRSARYAGDHGDFDAHMDLLLSNLQKQPDYSRVACFVAVLVYLKTLDDPMPLVFQGQWWGEVIDEKRGEYGFGYDPIFFDPKAGKTAAEMLPEEKNSLSHRAKALALLKDYASQHQETFE